MAEERVPILNYKPVFQKFVEANQALIACYQKSDVKGQELGQLDRLCVKEKNEIKGILNSNEMTMTRLVQDRVNVLYLLNEKGVKITI
jgi:hypothetical protein